MAEDVKERHLKCFVYKFQNDNSLKTIRCMKQCLIDKCLVYLRENETLEFVGLDRKKSDNSSSISNVKRYKLVL